MPVRNRPTPAVQRNYSGSGAGLITSMRTEVTVPKPAVGNARRIMRALFRESYLAGTPRAFGSRAVLADGDDVLTFGLNPDGGSAGPPGGSRKPHEGAEMYRANSARIPTTGTPL